MFEPRGRRYGGAVNREALRRTRSEIIRLGHSGLDWATFATQASDALRRIIPFDRCCWHPVDPGTLLFTGSLTRNLTCSGSWLAEYEYVQDDVNKWSFLALSGYRAGALSQATHGNLSLSARYRSAQTIIGDELRASCVVDGAYWGATGFIRDPGQPWFVEEEVRALASLSEPMADGLRRALLIWSVVADDDFDDEAPGLVVFDDQGRVELISPGPSGGSSKSSNCRHQQARPHRRSSKPLRLRPAELKRQGGGQIHRPGFAFKPGWAVG